MKFSEVMVPHRPPSNELTALQQRTETIYQTVRHRICTNRDPPDTLIHEEVLAKEFSVSRSPIRRVLSKLEHEGLVEIRHGVGTRHADRESVDSLVSRTDRRRSRSRPAGVSKRRVNPPADRPGVAETGWPDEGRWIRKRLAVAETQQTLAYRGAIFHY